MSLESIGTSKWSEGDLSQTEYGVSFRIPYGEGAYDITLNHDEMNLMLHRGIQKILDNKGVDGFDYTVDLSEGALPLFIGARAIHIAARPNRIHDIDMSLAAVSQSPVYEHRGRLLAHRYGWNGKWAFVEYLNHPPLDNSKDLPTIH